MRDKDKTKEQLINVRNDQNYWQQVETYINDHFEMDFSHGLCPTCMKKHNTEV